MLRSTYCGKSCEAREEDAASVSGYAGTLRANSHGGAGVTALLHGPRSHTSNYIGVWLVIKKNKRTGRWRAHIWDCGRQTKLGCFGSSHDAARAYDKARLWLLSHGVLVLILTACSFLAYRVPVHSHLAFS